ncbi:MAG: LL-diaminopimelate aminotransferase [Elusimicrobia bacterium]|nr:LL-diaminopimelate aminotransferase [Elusimicrobiota bacterium]
MHEFSDRLKKLPPYLFVEVDRMKQQAIQDGVDTINLGVGDPDIITPDFIRDRMQAAIDDPENHQYPLGKGKLSFRREVKSFMKKRFDCEFDENTEIHPLLGSKEGIAHMPLAFINPGDTAIITEPGYPVYNSGTVFAGGKPYFVPLKMENGFLPDWREVPKKVLNSARMLYINYPNNPTGAVATREFMEETVKLASKYGIIIVHDAAYSELYYGEPPMSLFEIEGAREIGIEFHSFSKTFCMTGWRAGWACGNAGLVEGLAGIKDNIDSGLFGAIQDAGIVALSCYNKIIGGLRNTYKERMAVMSAGLKKAGWKLNEPRATFYIWAKPPVKISSIEGVKKMIKDTGIICTPGSGFGPTGEGFIRFALTRDVERIKQAVERIENLKW